MIAKFNNKITDYSLIVGVDLAIYKTGIAVYDVNKNNFVLYKEAQVPDTAEMHFAELYKALDGIFSEIENAFEGKFLVIKEACPAQNGRFSTIKTLQGLAGAHAILELVLYNHSNRYDYYDDTGVYPVSVKALFRSEETPKPRKEDIRAQILKTYNIEDTPAVTTNISDAMGVVYTLVASKWDKDIDAYIKKLKKEEKELTSSSAVKHREQEIERLLAMRLAKD